MDTSIVIQTGTWKVKVILGIGGLVTLVILAFLYRFEVGLIMLGLGGMGMVYLGFWAKSKYVLSKLQERQIIAQTEAIELETKLNLWRVEQEKAIAQKMAYDSLFIERKSGTFVVGNLPYSFYPSASASRELATTPTLALPAPSLDFYQVMSDTQQAYAIVGPQRVGKSIMAQHLAQYLTRQGITCIVVGTKAQPGEWLNCRRYIGNETVPEALSSLMAEIKHRTEASINTPKLAIFLDDWINSVALDGNLAEQFFLESATRILTTGIVPYFLLQSDSKTDWGTKHGATLKNNFTHLLLNAPRENGKLNYDKVKAIILYPGDKEKYTVNLPVGLPMFGDNEPEIELAKPIEAEPTEQEQRVIELRDSGASMNKIALSTYGIAGGKQYQLIRDILEKHGRN